MAALGKITSSARNKSSADVLDKHPDSFSQPEPEGYQPRLVKRDGDSCLRNNRAHYNPPRKAKARPPSASKEQPKAVPDENTQKEDAQLALRLVKKRFSHFIRPSIHSIPSPTVFNVLGKYSSPNEFFQTYSRILIFFMSFMFDLHWKLFS